MEVLGASLLCLFVSIIFFTFNLLFYKTKPVVGTATRLPPGRTGWPVIGESLTFLSAGRKGHPEKFIFDRMAKYSSHIFKTHLYGERAAVFCGPEGNKFLYSNENKLVEVWWPTSFGKIFSHAPPKEHALTMKKMLPNYLKPEALRRYVGIMDHVAQRNFADGWDNKSEVLIFPLSKNYTFTLACRIFLSIEDPHIVKNLSEAFGLLLAGLFSIPINLPGTPFNTAIKASDCIREKIVAIIKQRKIDLAESKNASSLIMQDILSHMLLTSDENGKFMEMLDIADKILALLIGGHETASSACIFIVKYLAELPDVYQGVYEEQMEIAKSKAPGELLNWEDLQKMKYSWNVACEVMRLIPPIQGSFIEALTDFTYNGFSIPKGWKLYWNANSTHKNPKFFPEPLKFDPSRFEGSGPAPYTFVPFGGGPRMCPGKEYARMEILVFMHNIVKRFKWETIIPDEKIVVDPIPIPAKGLPIRLYPHDKAA